MLFLYPSTLHQKKTKRILLKIMCQYQFIFYTKDFLNKSENASNALIHTRSKRRNTKYVKKANLLYFSIIFLGLILFFLCHYSIFSLHHSIISESIYAFTFYLSCAYYVSYYFNLDMKWILKLYYLISNFVLKFIL